LWIKNLQRQGKAEVNSLLLIFEIKDEKRKSIIGIIADIHYIYPNNPNPPYLYSIDKGTPLPPYQVRTNTVPFSYQNRAPFSGDNFLGRLWAHEKDSPNFQA